jgi:hypothetical protein
VGIGVGTVVAAGYIFILSDLASTYVPVVPRLFYHGSDDWWHVPWLNVSLATVACLAIAAIVLLAFGYIRQIILILTGREDAYMRELYERAVIIPAADPRQRWRFGDE